MSEILNKKLKALLAEYVEHIPGFLGKTDVSVKTKSSFGEYPIHVAATRGSAVELGILLDAGADVNAIGENGYTPLHEAVEQEHIDVVKYLLDHGALVGIKNDDGKTPLDLAKTLEMDSLIVLLEKYVDKYPN